MGAHLIMWSSAEIANGPRRVCGSSAFSRVRFCSLDAIDDEWRCAYRPVQRAPRPALLAWPGERDRADPRIWQESGGPDVVSMG